MKKNDIQVENIEIMSSKREKHSVEDDFGDVVEIKNEPEQTKANLDNLLD